MFVARRVSDKNACTETYIRLRVLGVRLTGGQGVDHGRARQKCLTPSCRWWHRMLKQLATGDHGSVVMLVLLDHYHLIYEIPRPLSAKVAFLTWILTCTYRGLTLEPARGTSSKPISDELCGLRAGLVQHKSARSKVIVPHGPQGAPIPDGSEPPT